jgi:hypothetical protein
MLRRRLLDGRLLLLLLLRSWGWIWSCGWSGPSWKPGDVWSPLIDIYTDSGFCGDEGLGKVVVVLVLLSSCHGGFVSFFVQESKEKTSDGSSHTST